MKNNIEKPRSKKLNPRVDLTAMVNISFLLIVFYMVSVELSKPRIMDLGLPDTGCGVGFNYGCGSSFHRTVTLLLDDNNKIISYHGILDAPDDKPKIFSYGKNGIRNELLNKNKTLIKGFGDKEGIIVLIKPSKNSNFGNLVSILDEMSITNIQTYAIVNDFTPEEQNLLALN